MASTIKLASALRVTSSANQRGRVPHVRARQDLYALVLLVSLFCLLGLSFKGIGELVMPFRWGILALAAGAGLYQLQRAATFRMGAEHWSLIAMMVISLISCAYSVDPWYSAQRLVSFVLLWCAVFVGACAWLSLPKNVLVGAHLLYILVCFVTALSAFHLSQEGILDGERAEGAFSRATGAGTFAALALPVVIWKIRYSHGWTHRFAVAVLLVQAYLLFFSGARASTLAFVSGFTVVFWRQYRRYRLVMVTAALLLIALAAGGLIGLRNLPDYIVRKDSIASFTGRTLRWELGRRLFEMRPLTGHGYGMARYLAFMTPETARLYADNEPNPKRAEFALRAAAERKRVAFNLHSDHVERLVETGIVGYVSFTVFWGVIFLRMWQALFAPRTPYGDLARFSCVAAWIIFVDAFMHSVLFAVGNGATVLMWFQLALLGASVKAATAEQNPIFPGGRGVPHRGKREQPNRR